MASFGFIGEGVTDLAVIQNILYGFFSDAEEEPDLRPLQPPPMTPGTIDIPPGGWALVLEFLRRGEYREALPELDYLIIQIDTDVSEQKGYDVPWREAGRELTAEELAVRVVQKLESLIDADFYALHAHRFIFAIAVHQVECWLLPLLYDNNKAEKITGCLAEVNEARRRQNKTPLKRGAHKDYRHYDDASRPYRRRSTLVRAHARNPSLRLFIAELTRKAGAAPAPSDTGGDADT